MLGLKGSVERIDHARDQADMPNEAPGYTEVKL